MRIIFISENKYDNEINMIKIRLKIKRINEAV